MREEFADLKRRRELPELTARRLQLLRHSRCSCGEAAHALMNDQFLCRACADAERVMRRGRAMIAMARGFR